MSWTTANRDKLKAAIAAGGIVQSMTFGNQTFTFRSMDDMLKLLSVMEEEIATSSGGGSTARYAIYDKGV